MATVDTPIDPALFDRADLCPVLAERDIGALYRALNTAGISQRQIAQHTGQSQSEVSEILKGTRRVDNYRVLERIAEGLGIPRDRMGLSYGANGAYLEEVTVAEPEKAEDMLRRHLLAQGGIALTGATVTKLGELLAVLPGPVLERVPAQLGPVHVTRVQDLTRRLAEAGNRSVCDPDVLHGAAAWARRLLGVPGAELVKRSLRVAVGELHIEAGWSAFDAGLHRATLYHYAHAFELATEAGDACLQAAALRYAGLASVEHGHPHDGLKMLQCAQVKAWDIPPGDQRAMVIGVSGRAAAQACALEESATAVALLGDPGAAVSYLGRGRDLWTPTVSDPFGDMDRPAALLELNRGRLDVAEQFAAASVRRWERGSPISRTLSGIVLAAVHVRAGDSRSLPLAHQTITEVGKLTSVRARRRLHPLVEALDTRPGTDARDLARTARQVASTRV